jgi:hypothetical protein
MVVDGFLDIAVSGSEQYLTLIPFIDIGTV